MKLHYYRPQPEKSNFGDELNVFIWEHYFPNFFDDDISEVFFGIGTILRAAQKKYPTSKIIVFGSGTHSDSPQHYSNLQIDFVRGPLTAATLGLDDSKWITDPAIVTPEVFKIKNRDIKYAISYMPHYSVANNTYKEICEELCINYIDPTNPVLSIIQNICETEVLLTEAMHGAIVADAYRVPWLPIQSYVSFNHFKWQDWAKSLQLEIEIQKIPRFYENEKGIKFKLKKRIAKYLIKALCKRKPYLSSEKISNEAFNQVKQRIATFLETHR